MTLYRGYGIELSFTGAFATDPNQVRAVVSVPVFQQKAILFEREPAAAETAAKEYIDRCLCQDRGAT